MNEITHRVDLPQNSEPPQLFSLLLTMSHFSLCALLGTFGVEEISHLPCQFDDRVPSQYSRDVGQ